MFDDRVAAALAYTEHGLHRFGYVSAADLKLHCVRDALLTRRVYHPDRTFSGAVYDSAGQLIASTQRHNPGDIVPCDSPVIEAAERDLATQQRLDTALYGGILFPILGHFLVEAIARLWPLLGRNVAMRDRTVVLFHHWPDLDLDRIFGNPLYLAVLQAFGLSRETVRLVETGFSVGSLTLPDPASRYHLDLNAGMADVADHVAGRVLEAAGLAPTPAADLYLSRSRWSENTRIANESEIDSLAAARGLRVLHPQAMHPGELLAALRRARTVVACDGSHAHLMLFCRPETRVLMLDTRPVPTQFALARLRRFRTLHLPLFDGLAFDPRQRLVDPAALGRLVDAALVQLG